ncbi:LuxR C-terminal-related transcriptional regulator [Kitasatospora sp. NPDC096147]|uniref:LuxR C-terminal-related transcriptional regulator n=1 Tax=Kitasatospora sp. NPDC096147 TaxID=3364093 RepID=UPI0037FA76F3
MTAPSPSPTPSPSPAAARPEADPARLLRLLTPRETQALALLAAGRDTRAVAEALGVSVGTARTHLHRAMRKLGVHTRSEAATMAALLAPTPASAPAAAPTTGAPVSPAAHDTDPAPTGPGAHSPSGSEAPTPASAPAAAAAPVTGTPVGPAAHDTAPGPDPRPEGFEEFCTLVHTRLVQQTFLLTACRHRAVHAVHLALSVAGRRWSAVGALPDPEAWARAYAFEAAQAFWHRGGPRRAHLWRRPRKPIRVHPLPDGASGGSPEPDALTPRDRDLLKALGRLTRPQLRALVLHDALGLPAEEVAAEVQASTAAAAGRVRTARAALAASVPSLVGEDPTAEDFGDRLGGLLHQAAVRGCPAPKPPSPGLLRARGRLRSGLLTAAAGAVSLGMTGLIVATLTGNGPSALFREPPLAPPSVCSTADAGSAGPVLPGATPWPGVPSHWCGPTPGQSLPLGPAPAPATASGPGPLAEAMLPPAPADPPVAPAVAPVVGAAGAVEADPVVPPLAPVPVPVPAVPCPALRPCPTAPAPAGPPFRFELRAP